MSAEPSYREISDLHCRIDNDTKTRYFKRTVNIPFYGDSMTRLKLSEDLVPISDFRTRTAEVVAKIKKTKRPVILTQRGRSAAVLEDVREFERRCGATGVAGGYPSRASGSRKRSGHLP